MGMLVKLNETWIVDADTVAALYVINNSQKEEIDNDHQYELYVELNVPNSLPRSIYNYSYEHTVQDRMNNLQQEINLARTRA